MIASMDILSAIMDLYGPMERADAAIDNRAASWTA
jgi:hypothetical protein